MSVRAGSLMTLGFDGLSVPGWVRDFSSEFGLGGVILFARNCPSPLAVAALTAEIHTLTTPAPLVMIDQEGGRVERLRVGVPRLPNAAAMAAMETEEIEAMAYGQSLALAALGIDVNLAPVCDVVRPGESGAIGDRAWGGDPEKAVRGARAFHRGMRRGGVLGCAKHFPGHGASTVDTHLGAGVVELTEEELFLTDIPPFRALIENGVPMVMACHLTYPLVDTNPACFSSHWLEGVLRKKLGFSGVIITDDMEMGAVRGGETPSETAVRAISAGADMLIYGHMLEPELDVGAIAENLSSVLPAGRIDASAARVELLRGIR